MPTTSHVRLGSIARCFATALAALSFTACGDREKPAAPEPSAKVDPGAAPPSVSTGPTTTITLTFPQAFTAPQRFAATATLPALESSEPAPVPAEFAAPEGTVLMSQGKTVTASSRPVQGKLAMVTDGDASSYPDAVVVMPGAGSWVQVDLGQSAAIQKVHLWHAHHLGADVYRNVVVQISDDAAFATGVVTLFNNDTGNALGLGAGTDKAYIETNQGRLIDGKGQRARYVRVSGGGSVTDGKLRIAEVQVYAVP